MKNGLSGGYQLENAALAVTASLLLKRRGVDRITEENVRQGLAGVKWPGRLEYINGSVTAGKNLHFHYLLDGAHNPSGVEGLLETIAADAKERDKILVWGAMADKRSGQVFLRLAEEMREVILTRPESERAATAEQIMVHLPTELQRRCRLTRSVEEGLQLAEELAGKESLIVVAGSLYLIGEVRKALLGELVDE